MTVIPFPRVRNRSFVVRHARRMAAMSQTAGERHLERLLRDQMEISRRRGIPEEVIADEARAVEAAIRAALWSVILFEGGAA